MLPGHEVRGWALNFRRAAALKELLDFPTVLARLLETNFRVSIELVNALGPRYRNRLTLRLIFHLPLRQAEGFLTSLFALMGLDLPSPDHTTLSRRGQHLDLAPRSVPRRAGIHLIIDSTGLSIGGRVSGPR